MDMMSIRRSVLAQSWQEPPAYEVRNLVLDGTNYYNTEIYLYSSENINRDFEMLINYDDPNGTLGGKESQATLVNSKNEATGYPGFVLRRYTNSNKLEFSGLQKIQIPYTDIINKDLRVVRANGAYSLQYGIGKMNKLSVSDAVHNTPVSIGASIKPDGSRFRFGAFTLNHMYIKWLTHEAFDISQITWSEPSSGSTITSSLIIPSGEMIITCDKVFQIRDGATPSTRLLPDVMQYTDAFRLNPSIAPNGFRIWILDATDVRAYLTEVLKTLKITSIR